jgi:hypothetical protein
LPSTVTLGGGDGSLSAAEEIKAAVSSKSPAPRARASLRGGLLVMIFLSWIRRWR